MVVLFFMLQIYYFTVVFTIIGINLCILENANVCVL